MSMGKGSGRRPPAISRQEEAERWAKVFPPCPHCPWPPDLDINLTRAFRPCARHADVRIIEASDPN